MGGLKKLSLVVLVMLISAATKADPQEGFMIFSSTDYLPISEPGKYSVGENLEIGRELIWTGKNGERWSLSWKNGVMRFKGTNTSRAAAQFFSLLIEEQMRPYIEQRLRGCK